MNIKTFTDTYDGLKDVDQIPVDGLCDHPDHVPAGKMIGRGAAKRNILKNRGEKFVCRACDMKHFNPMTKVGQRRQTDEVVTVYCPCSDHEGDLARQMKKACYYGAMVEPYLQVCGSCAQRGKVVSQEQREAISRALTGIKRSDEFKEKLRLYMTTNPEGIQRAEQNLVPGFSGGWNKGQETPEDVREKMSAAMTGRVYSEEHKANISAGRKAMLLNRR